MTIDTTVPTTPLIPLIAMDELPEGRGRRVCAAGYDLAVFRVGDAVYAIDDSCPHAGASLVMGQLDGATVSCRAHGLRFDLATGCMRDALSLLDQLLSFTDGMVTLAQVQAPARAPIESISRTT